MVKERDLHFFFFQLCLVFTDQGTNVGAEEENECAKSSELGWKSAHP